MERDERMMEAMRMMERDYGDFIRNEAAKREAMLKAWRASEHAAELDALETGEWLRGTWMEGGKVDFDADADGILFVHVLKPGLPEEGWTMQLTFDIGQGLDADCPPHLLMFQPEGETGRESWELQVGGSPTKDGLTPWMRTAVGEAGRAYAEWRKDGGTPEPGRTTETFGRLLAGIDPVRLYEETLGQRRR